MNPQHPSPGPRSTSHAVGHAHRWAALAVLCASALIINVDNTILNVALPTLVRKLHATSSELQWIVDSYALVFAGLLLVSGSLADRLGRKRFFLIGMTVFACGSIGAAFSGSVDLLIAWRAVMGAGAAMTIPASLSIINDVFRDQAERARAIGGWAATIGLGIAIGPIAGGLLLAKFWWGSVFLVNVPIAIAAVVGATVLVPDSKNPAADRPDPVGAALSIAGLGLVLWAIIEGPTAGWSSASVVWSRSGRDRDPRHLHRLGGAQQPPDAQPWLLSRSQFLDRGGGRAVWDLRPDGGTVPPDAIPAIRSWLLTPSSWTADPARRGNDLHQRAVVPADRSSGRDQAHRRRSASRRSRPACGRSPPPQQPPRPTATS